jgi:hypothetical protein
MKAEATAAAKGRREAAKPASRRARTVSSTLSGSRTEQSEASGEETLREEPTGAEFSKVLAEKQMLFEQSRLTRERMVDVSSGSAIKQDELKDLLKLVVPDIRKRTDRLMESIKACARMSASSPRLMLAAQNKYEEAIDWISQVEDKCREEQLHLDVKQPVKEVDFKPFRGDSSVSVYEFRGLESRHAIF